MKRRILHLVTWLLASMGGTSLVQACYVCNDFNVEVGLEITVATPKPCYAMAPIPCLVVIDGWYPWALRRVAVGGSVVVSAEIDRAGRVTEMKVIRADFRELADAVEQRFRQLRFWPARDGPRAVPAHVVAEVTFVVHD